MFGRRRYCFLRRMFSAFDTPPRKMNLARVSSDKEVFFLLVRTKKVPLLICAKSEPRLWRWGMFILGLISLFFGRWRRRRREREREREYNFCRKLCRQAEFADACKKENPDYSPPACSTEIHFKRTPNDFHYLGQCCQVL